VPLHYDISIPLPQNYHFQFWRKRAKSDRAQCLERCILNLITSRENYTEIETYNRCACYSLRTASNLRLATRGPTGRDIPKIGPCPVAAIPGPTGVSGPVSGLEQIPIFYSTEKLANSGIWAMIIGWNRNSNRHRFASGGTYPTIGTFEGR